MLTTDIVLDVNNLNRLNNAQVLTTDAVDAEAIMFGDNFHLC